MALLNRGYILLYGGEAGDILLCDFHLYKFETKTWLTPTDYHEFQLPALQYPSIISMNDGIFYLFGG